jgi:hypothetical protein
MAQAEYLAEQGSIGGTVRTTGWYVYAVYQPARQWKVGIRWDEAESLADHSMERGTLALVQYQPSEFSTLSAQFRRVQAPGGAEHDAAFFKWTFNIGPHGAHPY